MIDLLATFIVFFAVIDPIGTLPVFIALTGGLDEHHRRMVAVRATVASALILLSFVVAGELVLYALGIPLSAFEIAGGIVLFLFALSMIFGESKPEQEIRLISAVRETAVFPLAIPSIASPGAILAAVMETEKSRFNLWEQVQVSAIMLAVLLVTLLMMLASTSVYRLIGDSGASVMSRVMGLILASVATESVLSGIKTYFSL